MFSPLLLILPPNALRNLIVSTYKNIYSLIYIHRLSAKLSAQPADEVVKSQLVIFRPTWWQSCRLQCIFPPLLILKTMIMMMVQAIERTPTYIRDNGVINLYRWH